MKAKHAILSWLFATGIILCLTGCTPADNRSGYDDTTTAGSNYDEPHRPQFHFSPETGWMNDPNGMVYYDGEYHLFYQYYPDSTVWGPMHWGHAVSTDLVSWQHLPIGLYPDDLGYIFSGSAVVDWENTSGFGSSSNAPMVAIFTHHLMEGEKAGRTDYQYQSIAYSLDKGRTWTKYDKNPVLPNQGIKDFRDPKVFWYKSSQKWIMILAVWDHVELYSSPDLKSWSKLSDFGVDQGDHGGVWECPDLFELPVEGTDQTQWVMIVSIGRGGPNKGSATQYFLGEFDGVNFTNSNSPELALWLDYGPDNYAGVTWSDVPVTDGRRLFIGWMSNWLYAQIVPTDKWRSAMTVPRSMTLIQTNEGPRLKSIPVAELENNRVSETELGPQQISADWDLNIPGSLLELELEFGTSGGEGEYGVRFYNDKNQEVLIGYSQTDNEFFIDRVRSGQVQFYEDFASRVRADRIADSESIKMRVLLDNSSIEVFADDGVSVLSAVVFPGKPYDKASLYTTAGPVLFNGGRLHVLGTIW